jgi:hypothetical protein
MIVRHPTEHLSATAGVLVKRVLPTQLDKDGVLQLEAAFLAGLQKGDALGVPGRLPTCESCWTEPAVAAALGAGDAVTFRGLACIGARQGASVRLVALVPS